MLTINARVFFKTKENGGLHRNGISGMQPSFSVADDLIMCQVVGAEGVAEFLGGNEYYLTIRLPYGEMFADEIVSGYTFGLNIGGKEFATGVVV